MNQTYATGNDRFNAEAAAWDSNPDVHRASDGALQVLLEKVDGLREKGASGGLDVLEIGCGTGLLSFRVAPYVRSLLAVDASEGMISALEQKLSKPDAPQNVKPLCIMLEDPEDSRLPPSDSESDAPDGSPRMKYDVILSHLVLHHIPDLEPLLVTMLGCLKPGGCIALTDFEDFGPQARKFHPEAKMTGVERDGIPREGFAKMMRDVGYVDVHCEVGFSMPKDVERWPGEWGHIKPESSECESMDFPFLICSGKRP